ncbi:MAG: hypothetical protein CMH91_03720 [Oceanicaulis sp.]|uniref:DUF6460 domain-containing protein n=1 Tax=unclassified Oceanicaulis TaxID=2632123 RepID=UPI000C55B26A|nr:MULTISPECIES: DUF6460 domain-containing protein [unclassified Oceanicaulis]MAB70865.1 hypothetical protein [Oceanicaulis sp.]MBC38159.1 hypothetical protein [Oceanicaulis sp.]MBG34890.1 hypothetical protein [Oceanicaulis sp.]HBU62858.1 hypothetical protein [Oceanicaulis sp.]|tara:strand:+ start:254 stop:565 length:312 start_codon:yes stop_codon:yes gene_type:complete
MSEQTPHSAGLKSMLQRVLSVRFADLMVVFLLCVLVGLVLAVFQVDPADLWVDFFQTVGDAWASFFDSIGASLRWALRYFFLGAVIVLPIWLAVHLVRAFTKR